MHIDFDTAYPLEISVAIAGADIAVRAHDGSTARVEASGDGSDGVTAQLVDGALIVEWSSTGRRHSADDLDVTVIAPVLSSLRASSGSGDLTVVGPWTRADLTATSGDIDLVQVAGPATLIAGSGDIAVERVEGGLRVKSGSGDVRIVACDDVDVSTGSGDVVLASTLHIGSIATGSGDVVIRDVAGTVAVAAASGNIEVDTFSSGALDISTTSGDVHLGVVTGMPVWADLHSGGGEITNRLSSAGEPADGQAYLELRARSGSGDITIDPIAPGTRVRG